MKKYSKQKYTIKGHFFTSHYLRKIVNISACLHLTMISIRLFNRFQTFPQKKRTPFRFRCKHSCIFNDPPLDFQFSAHRLYCVFCMCLYFSRLKKDLWPEKNFFFKVPSHKPVYFFVYWLSSSKRWWLYKQCSCLTIFCHECRCFCLYSYMSTIRLLWASIGVYLFSVNVRYYWCGRIA